MPARSPRRRVRPRGSTRVARRTGSSPGRRGCGRGAPAAAARADRCLPDVPGSCGSGVLPVAGLRQDQLELVLAEVDQRSILDRLGSRFGRRGPRDGRGELGDGLVLEEEGGAEVEAGLAGARDDLDAEDGVAAEGEEVVVDADALDAEDGLPDAGEGGL